MIHPLFRLLVSEPQLVTDHVEAYSELVAEEVGVLTTQWKRRALLYAAAGMGMLLALLLIAIALMLWAAVPTESMHAPWVLVAVPGATLVLALWAFLAAKAPIAEHGFKTLREQFAADAAMLRSVTAP